MQEFISSVKVCEFRGLKKHTTTLAKLSILQAECKKVRYVLLTHCSDFFKITSLIKQLRVFGIHYEGGVPYGTVFI